MFLHPLITRFLLLAGFLLTTPALIPAQDLLKSRQAGELTYIYKISDQEAKTIIRKPSLQMDSTYFHRFIDAYPTDSAYRKQLAPGHYLKTCTNANHRTTEYAFVPNFDVLVLNNNTDLYLQIYDLQGNQIKNALVKINSKKLKFDAKTQCYVHKKSNKKGLLSVTCKGNTAYYQLDRAYNNSAFLRGARTFIYGTPLKYIWIPVAFVAYTPIDAIKSIKKGHAQGVIWEVKWFVNRTRDKIRCLWDEDYCGYHPKYLYDKHTGYVVFNKPKYLPGDTVKFKAFILKKNGTPINKPVEVRLNNGSGKTYTLFELNPYRNGAYESQFLLHDSLNLKLDRQCSLLLTDKNTSSSWDYYVNGDFYYEEYELSKIQLDVRAPSDNHYNSIPVMVFARGTDENRLNLMDARVKITAKPKNANRFFDDSAFLPDTLFTMEKDLNPRGETEIAVSDSLFPPVNFDYELTFVLLTSDNRTFSITNSYHYFYRQQQFELLLPNDSLECVYLENGIRKDKPVEILAVDHSGRQTTVFSGETPCRIPVNPYFQTYIARNGDWSNSLFIALQPSLIQCFSQRTSDSVHIEIQNPRNIRFTYNIYRKNSEQVRGAGNQLNYQAASRSKQNYFLSLRYLWGGEIKEETYRIPFYDKKLTIQVDQPALVYPGQTANTEITVTDIHGKPVENVDLTAYSLTSKFNFQAPEIPSFSKEYPNKTLVNNFRLTGNDNRKYSSPLDYEYWKQLARLDTIEYYRFLYPENQLYTYIGETNDTTTQFAPFVVSEKGEIVPVHVIYVDSKPVYFSWSTIRQPYSFRVNPGKHQIRLRLIDREIQLDKMDFPSGKKLIFSLRSTVSGENIRILPAKNQLGNYERVNLYPYIFPYRNTFGNNLAYIRSDSTIQELNTTDKLQTTGRQLAGPINGPVNFQIHNDYTTRFTHEPYFEYDFSKELLKMREVSKQYYPLSLLPFNRTLSTFRLRDQAVTMQSIENEWNEYIYNKRRSNMRYRYPTQTSDGYGRLQLNIHYENDQTYESPLNILLFRYDDSRFLRVYPGNTSLMHQLEAGDYQVIFFFENDRYYSVDTVPVKTKGLNYWKIILPTQLQKNEFSQKINQLINDYFQKDLQEKDKELATIYQNYQWAFTYTGEGQAISGYVFDVSDGEPIIGASVSVKGTHYGTVTDIDGKYSMKVPWDKHILQFSFIGYITKELDIQTSSTTAVGMEADSNVLDEVVVVGYGVSRKSDLTASISTVQTLQGRVAGLTSVNEYGTLGAGPAIQIRGISSVSDNAPILYVVDGIIVEDIATLNHEDIATMEVVKDASATALYGARAANGVVIISTKGNAGKLLSSAQRKEREAGFDAAFAETALQSGAIRSQFSDYAYWQPRLTTDKQGKASFQTTFPDDITNWNTYVLAMNDRKQSGQTQGNIRSFKPIMAQLATPRFLIEGDTTHIIGKSLNYTSDTISVSTSFEVNGKPMFQKRQAIADTRIDTLQLAAPADSLKIRYILTKSDGYFDGEEREIPVYPAGLEEARGDFLILDKDTVFTKQWDSCPDEIHLYAKATALDVIQTEIERVLNYRYLCNEQLASKLKALLLQKKIAEQQGIPWKGNKNVQSIIEMLLKRRNSTGWWGWWQNSETDYPFSLHALTALSQAKQTGFSVDMDLNKMGEQAVHRLDESKDNSYKINLLRILKNLDAPVDLIAYIRTIREDSLNLNDYLKLMELKQWTRLPVNTSTLEKFRQETLFGNVYFDNPQEKKPVYDPLENNAVQNTLLAYRILKRENNETQEALLKRMRLYLLENKSAGGWRNTYESINIMETILPDLLGEQRKINPTVLTLSGDINQSVYTQTNSNKSQGFPFETSFHPNRGITLKKTGDDPVYLTFYRREWNKNPQEKQNDFIIQTHFENGRDTLEAGKPVKLIAKLSVKKDADYVMINIPIPAGCSYGAKPQRYYPEIHREYFKQETAIFCQKLKAGEYVFEVELLPRFAGIYYLNPAKVELMYFPTFNANEGMKWVKI